MHAFVNNHSVFCVVYLEKAANHTECGGVAHMIITAIFARSILCVALLVVDPKVNGLKLVPAPVYLTRYLFPVSTSSGIRETCHAQEHCCHWLLHIQGVRSTSVWHFPHKFMHCYVETFSKRLLKAFLKHIKVFLFIYSLIDWFIHSFIHMTVLYWLCVHFQMCQIVTIIERRRSGKQSSFRVPRNCLKMLPGRTWVNYVPAKHTFIWVVLDPLTHDSRCWTKITHTVWWYTMLLWTTLVTTFVLKTSALEADISTVSLLKVFLLGRNYFLFTQWLNKNWTPVTWRPVRYSNKLLCKP